MVHPLLRLVATEPQILGDHVAAYAELVGDEVRKTGSALGRSAALYGGAALLLLIGVIFLGVALMLWATVPAGDLRAPWVLIAVPLVTLAGGIGCFFAARSNPIESAFDNVKAQVNADMAMLREVAQP
jgi:hypothetical protein